MDSTTSHVPHSKRKGCLIKLAVFVSLLLLLTLALCQPIHYSREISGHVIDTTDGGPLEGAVVVAAWYLTGMEGAHVATIATDEAMTAADGSFTIDSWGPRIRKPALFASLDSDMPKLLIFKDGFLPTYVENIGSGPPYRFHGPEGLAYRFLDKEVFPLEPFSGSLVEYLPYLQAVNNRIYVLRGGQNCEWKQIPQFILALDTVAQTATRRGLEGGAGLAKLSIPPRDCGTAAEFFGVVDDDLVPCENRVQCAEKVRSYDGPPESFLLPVPPWISMRDDGVIDNVILDAIQEKGWELDGFEVRYKYSIYYVKQWPERLMLTKDDAYSLVEAELSGFDPDVDPVIVKEATREFSWGWVIYYQSEKYLETNEIRYALAGNAPYIVNKHSGELETTGTALPVEQYIQRYESKIAEQ